MSSLSQMQIETFFKRVALVTQKQCNNKAKEISGKSVIPTACQGGTSYTVDAGQVIVQFRIPSSPLDMTFMNSIEQAYPDFTPRHKDCGSFHNLHVYTMNNIGGLSMYLARGFLQRNNYELLRNTIDSYARFVNTNTQAAFLPSDFALPTQGNMPATNSARVDSSPRRIITRLSRRAGQIASSFFNITRHGSNGCARGFPIAFTQRWIP